MKKITKPVIAIGLVIALVAFSSFAVSYDFNNELPTVKGSAVNYFLPVKDSIGSQKAFLAA